MFFRIYQHLLPRAEAWKIVAEKALRRLFVGLASWPADARAFIDSIWLDSQPSTTRELASWEEQFGLYPANSEDDRRLNVAGEWASQGGQGPAYLQGVLRKAGFACTVYGPWINFGDFGAPLLWLRADDYAATFSGSDFATIPNRGTLGGNATPAVGAGPARSEISGKWAAVTTTNGGLQFGDVNSLKILHEPGTSSTLVIRVRVDAQAGRLFLTRSLTVGQQGIGVILNGSGVVRLLVGDGTNDVLDILTPASSLPTAQTTLAIRKTGALFEILIDGVVKASGTASNLAAGPSADITYLGSSSTDTSSFSGAICEAVALPYAASASQLASFGEILTRWSGSSGFVARDPRSYTNFPLVGKTQCGNATSQCGESQAQCSSFLVNDPKYLVNKDLTGNAPPNIPFDSASWAFFLYLAGDTIDSPFLAEPSRRAELERLILKIRPLESWIVINASFPTGYLITGSGGFLSLGAGGALELS